MVSFALNENTSPHDGSKIRLSVWMLSFLLLPLTNIAQQEDDQRYDFEINNQSLHEVLDRLSQMAGVNFTFNAADPTFAKKSPIRPKKTL